MDSIESCLQQEAHFGIVHSQFNGELCDRLVTGAEEFLRNRKINDNRIIKLKVPGAFELPLGVQYLAEHFAGHQTASSPNTPVGVIALGVIIRGETPHFEYVAAESASGIMQVSLKLACRSAMASSRQTLTNKPKTVVASISYKQGRIPKRKKNLSEQITAIRRPVRCGKCFLPKIVSNLARSRPKTESE